MSIVKPVDHLDKTIIGKPEPWLIAAAAEIDLDFSAFSHVLTNELKNHALKRHGDPAISGAAAIVPEDFDRIPGIIKEPDLAIIGAIRKGSLFNVYAKTSGSITFLYFEDVLQGRKNKTFRGKTFYWVNKPLALEGFKKIVTMNGKTDASRAAILDKKIAARGHPDG